MPLLFIVVGGILMGGGAVFAYSTKRAGWGWGVIVFIVGFFLLMAGLYALPPNIPNL
jgi:hypothetical protein